MNAPPQSWIPRITLLLLAIVSGIIWRAELEMRGGWAGLTWLTYFHWAVPACVGTFLVWVLGVTRVRHPLAFAAALLGFAVLAYVAVDYLAHFCFARRHFEPSRAGLNQQMLMGCLLLLYWLLLPLAFCALCRGFGVPVKVGPMLAAAALCLLSWPLAGLVRSFFEQRGGQDALHALKSGFVIPFLIFSLGLPLLRARRLAVP